MNKSTEEAFFAARRAMYRTSDTLKKIFVNGVNKNKKEDLKMKIDCSKTENYFTEKRRMTDMCNDKKCKTCPLSFYHNEAELSCNNFEQKYPKKAVEMVQKWSNEHPRKTKKEAFLEVFSNAIIGHDGYPSIPPCKIYGIANGVDPCGKCKGCASVWDEPAEVE